MKVKICGAGSIGNHLAYACRTKGWDVLICDTDIKALERTKNNIYPSRYGNWDENIKLSLVNELKKDKFDLIIIGTPPDTHLKLAIDILKNTPPKVLLIEKPLCIPSIRGCEELLSLSKSCGTFVAVGYNHTLTKNTQMAADILKDSFVGQPLTISAMFREHWGGIFAAHPWLNGPADSYLGFFERGGGASGEHSHAINIWQHFAHLLGAGRIIEVSAMLNIIEDGKAKYDSLCLINAKTEEGLVGNIIQDVITDPPQKNLRVQGNKGFLEWHVNFDKNNDALFYGNSKTGVKEKLIAKKRPDDFIGEIDHLNDILQGKDVESPISVERGLDTMMVVAAAHYSYNTGRTVRIDYKKGYCHEAIKIL